MRERSTRPAARPLRGARAGLGRVAPLALLLLLALGCFLGAVPAATSAAPAPAAPELVRLRFWTAPEHTRLVFDLSGAVPATTKFRMTDSTTFEVFMPRVRKSPAVTTEFVGDSLVADIFPAVSDSGTSVRIHLKRKVTPLGFVLAAADGVPDRVVVDVPMPVNPAAEQALEQKVTELKSGKKMFIVAIDAGHGGEDTGAIGYRHLQEADITLAVARKLKSQLDLIPGISAVLTRTSDYFIPLRKRIDLARKYQADLFVSIHCNASRNHDATGTEIYFLSPNGATDEASRSLAEKENAADMIGGVPPESGDDLISILFDLRQNDTVRRSSELAELLIDAVSADTRLSTRGVKQAGFVVLKAPEIPSVLVETAFITNPREAAILKDTQFQNKFAEHLAQGIQSYKAMRDRASGGAAAPTGSSN
ncbi:MAG TPA: N-acetylmuramoyl-L-alanine amidase [Candidatus Binatia bacterium]|nr:N-acetylmuramoyl-L-alanine amidase [Candidatus Binatia bacterium]